MALENAKNVGQLVATNPTAADPKSQGDDHLRLIKAALLNSFAGFPGMVIVTGAEAQGATVNDYVVAVSPAPEAYTSNFVMSFKTTHANSAGATLQINALGQKPFVSVGGGDLSLGDIPIGIQVLAWYDGTSFLLLTPSDRSRRGGDTYAGIHDFLLATLFAATANQGDNSKKVANTEYVDAGLGTKASLSSPAFTDLPTAPTAPPGTSTHQLATCDFVMAQTFLPGSTEPFLLYPFGII